MRRPPVSVRSVLVTGCSSGIGRATAELLRRRGWTVWPTARSPEDLAGLADAGFDPVALDVADENSVAACAAEVLARSEDGLGGVVNNAGFAQAGAVEDLSRGALTRQFEVNVFGLQSLTNRLVPRLRSQGWGRIVHVSSIYGLISAPLVGAYCASKFALEALSDAQRLELWPTGVGVSLVEPGPIATRFRANAAEAAEDALDASASRFGRTYARRIVAKKDREHRPGGFTKPPEAVARAICHALESRSPRRRYRITVPAHLGAVARCLLPAALVDRLLLRTVK